MEFAPVKTAEADASDLSQFVLLLGSDFLSYDRSYQRGDGTPSRGDLTHPVPNVCYGVLPVAFEQLAVGEEGRFGKPHEQMQRRQVSGGERIHRQVIAEEEPERLLSYVEGPSRDAAKHDHPDRHVFDDEPQVQRIEVEEAGHPGAFEQHIPPVVVGMHPGAGQRL